MSGVVVAADASLRVCHAGVLSAWGPDLTLLWQIDLTPQLDNVYRGAGLRTSLPTVLRDGSTLIAKPNGLIRVAAGGVCVEVFDQDEYVDDSGMSPNVTNDGNPIRTSREGGVFILVDGQWSSLSDRRS